MGVCPLSHLSRETNLVGFLGQCGLNTEGAQGHQDPASHTQLLPRCHCYSVRTRSPKRTVSVSGEGGNTHFSNASITDWRFCFSLQMGTFAQGTFLLQASISQCGETHPLPGHPMAIGVQLAFLDFSLRVEENSPLHEIFLRRLWELLKNRKSSS